MADSRSNVKHDDVRLQRFREWLMVNGGQPRCCEVRPRSNGEGFGLFATQDTAQGVLMVTPLYLAITPMTVLQDPELGSHYGKLMQSAEDGAGEVDDRLLMLLFLLIERARGQSSFWAPYLDMLPTKFGTPLCYSEEELLELKGTHLHQATHLQRRSLKLAFEHKVKTFAEEALSFVESERREVEFQDFMWANSVFWTRALNIPCPSSFVFPDQLPVPPSLRALQLKADTSRQQHEEAFSRIAQFCSSANHLESCSGINCPSAFNLSDETHHQTCVLPNNDTACNKDTIPWIEALTQTDTEDVQMVEGLVPGIDFCNHDRREGAASWQIDGPQGSVTGVPNSMFLVTGSKVCRGSEIFISYGDKGNEELLYLYGFVMEENLDDYLMIYFPKQALEVRDCHDTKIQLLEELNLPLRWLVPSSALKWGFCASDIEVDSTSRIPGKPVITGRSWSGQRKASALAAKLVFPEDLLTALRIVAMEEEEVYRVVALLEEISDPEAGRKPTDVDVRAAVWEVCGNVGAFQLLVDLLTSSMLELLEGTGVEALDADLLAKDRGARLETKEQSHADRASDQRHSNLLSDNKRASVIYRMGQKFLVRSFLKEAECALELCVDHVAAD